MHALLFAAHAALAHDLAEAWASGAAGSVEAAVLPAAASGPVPTGVFVPLSSLGLRAAPPSNPADERLRALLEGADLVAVHLDVLDDAALHDGGLARTARLAAERALPVVVLAGRSESTRRAWSTQGVSGVHEVGDAAQARRAAVARVARTWAPSWSRGPVAGADA